MISAAPLLRLMAERELTTEQISQLTDIPVTRVKSFKYGFTMVNQKELDVLCRVLNCQPCDLVEYRKEARGGHWEWIDD